jgi:hypothetical protein
VTVRRRREEGSTDIEVDGFLADAVSGVDGKLYALGAGWNRIFVPMFPARHDRIGVGLLFHLAAGTTSTRRRFGLRIETPAGSALQLASGPAGPVISIDGEFTAGGPEDAIVPIAIQLDGVPLETPGAYAVIVSVDGEEVKRLPFVVTTHAAAGTAEASPATGTAGYL